MAAVLRTQGEGCADRGSHDEILVFINLVRSLHECGIKVLVVQSTTVAPGKNGRPGKAQGELLAEVVADGGIDEVSCRAGIIVEDTVCLVVGIDTVGEVVNVPDGEFESAMGVGSIIVELLVVTVRLHSAPQSEAEVVVVVGDGDVIVEGQSL